MSNKKIIGICIIFLISISIILAPPVVDKTVKGIIYESDGITQVSSGTYVYILDKNNSVWTSTYTSGPTGNGGRYSTTISSNVSDIIYVLGYNATTWGNATGVMGQTSVTIDFNLNKTRDSETQVEIILPINNTILNTSKKSNLTVDITILGNDATLCNATISFSNPGILGLGSGETYTHNLGNLNRGDSVTEVWNLSILSIGTTNISIFAECSSDGVNLENKNMDYTYNITTQDDDTPIVKIIYPLNNSRLNNPILFYYNVSEGMSVQSCELSINDVVTNTTTAPAVDTTLNFTYIVPTKYNMWEINCTDTSGNEGTSGLYNLTINGVPSITTQVIEDPINLRAGTNKSVMCNGTVTDTDSFNDITNINASLFYQGYSTNSVLNQSNMYKNSTCTLQNGAGNTIDFICGFDVEYFANNGTWYCNATAIDIINSTNSSEISTTINPLLAIGVEPTIINFGQMEVLQISPNDVEINVTNYGNVPLDLNLYAYSIFENDNISMACAVGNISLSNERFSLQSGQSYTSMTPVNNTLNPVFVNINISKKEGGYIGVKKKPVYWKLQIPMWTQGLCNGKVFFTAINS